MDKTQAEKDLSFFANKFSRRQNGELVYLTAENLTNTGKAVHAFTTRYGGVSKAEFSSLNLGFNRGDTHENVTANYDIICRELNIKREYLTLSRQVHEDGIKIITRHSAGSGIVKEIDYIADALITAEPGIPLVIFTADCIPVLMLDPEKRVAAAVHSGWRGTVLGIVRKTAEMMREVFDCKPGDIKAAIGPGIGACCFETDSDVPGAFYGVMSHEAGRFITKTGERFRVDLKEINKHWLKKTGVLEENIAVSEECTMCDYEKYWSHRKTGGIRGSQAAVISLI